jgi:subtilisin family serine protease
MFDTGLVEINEADVMTPVTAAGLDALALVNLLPLMERTSGRPEIVVGVVDGPVAMGLSALAAENIQQADGPGDCSPPGGFACRHGTFVAGILSARRSSSPAGICPGCTLLVRPIFLESSGGEGELLPQATLEELAVALRESVEAGVHVVNLSAAVVGHFRSFRSGERPLTEALDKAMQRGTLVVAAAGNQGDIGGSLITEHPWVIPVAAYGLRGQPLDVSNLGASIGRRGLGAPGERVTGFSPGGQQVYGAGTSAATPFVTGAIALLWSAFPTAAASVVRSAVTQSRPRRRTIVPPLLDAWKAYQLLSATEVLSAAKAWR